MLSGHLDNDPSLILSMSKLAHFSYLQNAVSIKYFFQEYVSKGKHGGKCSIVAKTISQSNNSLDKYATMEQTHITFKMVELLLHLTRKKQKRTMCLIGRLLKLFSSQKNEVNTQIPTDISEAQAMCLDGRHSVFLNLPGIKVHNINDHAVLSISNVIDQILGLGVPVEWLQDASSKHNCNGIYGSNRAEEVLNYVLLSCKNPSQTAVGGLIV